MLDLQLSQAAKVREKLLVTHPHIKEPLDNLYASWSAITMSSQTGSTGPVSKSTGTPSTNNSHGLAHEKRTTF